VDSAEAFDLVEAHFGGIPAGVPPDPVPLAPLRAVPSRLALEDRVELPRLYLGWLSPALYAEGDAELDLLADALAGGKSSRLYRSLVYERRLATDVSASQGSRERGGAFQVVATAAPGVPLGLIERAIGEELDRVRTAELSEDELGRTMAMAETAFVSRLQTAGGFGGKADQLNHYNVVLGDPGRSEWDLDRYRKASRPGIQRAAAVTLDPSGCVALSVVPAGVRELAAPDSRPAVAS